MKISSSKRRGFTLMEILVCLSILIALATGALVVGGDLYRSGRYNSAKASVSAVAIAVQQYRFEIETYPATLNALTAKVGQYGPWIEEDALQDPWDNDYLYTFDATNNKFVVWSMGANGTNNSGDNPETFSEDDIGFIGH